MKHEPRVAILFVAALLPVAVATADEEARWQLRAHRLLAEPSAPKARFVLESKLAVADISPSPAEGGGYALRARVAKASAGCDFSSVFRDGFE